MSEMVERVARTICENKLWLGAWEKETDGNREEWRMLARAAIAAMRGPTKAMIVAAHSCVAVGVWEDMIDEALK